MLEEIPVISAMSLDQRTHVPQGEISGGEATVEKGATEVVGAEVETEVAMVETEVEEVMVETGVVVAMVQIEVGVVMETGVGVAMVGIEEVAMEETEVVMVETEGAAMEETEVAMEEIEEATEVIEAATEVIEEDMVVIEVDMEETAAGGPMEETVVVVVAVEATVETEVEAMVETEVVATEETEVGVMEATEVAMEETEVALEARWEEETTTEMISATDHTDDCFKYSFVSDMIHGELSECACCFPHGLLGSEIDIWVFIWVGGLGTVFLLEMSIKIFPFSFPPSLSQPLKLNAL